MKELSYKSILTLVWILVAFMATAKNGNDYEKSKQISKTYQVNDEVLLDVSNSFGQVHINTWNENRIEVVIDIITRMSSERRAEELLDKIEIKISESSSEKSFETVIAGKLKSGNNEKFEINYLVNMPKGNPLKLKNSFGNTYIGDLAGNCDIKLSYGDFRIAQLSGNTDLKVSFSDGEIQGMTLGELEIKYSDVEIEKIGKIRLDQGFSDVKIETATTIDLTSKYGELEIGSVQGVRGYVGYSDFSIDRLETELDLETAYAGDFQVNEISRNFSKINIDGKFGDFNLIFEEGVNFDFKVQLSFSDFSYSGLPLEFNKKIKESFKATYEGLLGKGSGGVVDVNSSYGDVRFR